MEVTLYSDGSSRAIPGRAATAPFCATRRPRARCTRRELSAGFSCTTNNRMELLAASWA